MTSAAMALTAMIMMIAVNARIEHQIPHQQCSHRIIGIAADTAEKLNPGLRQRCLGPTANTATDQHIHLMICQKSCQSTVPAAVCFHDPGSKHRVVLYLIDFKCLGMSEMLKNLSIRICNRNNHRFSPFRRYLPFCHMDSITYPVKISNININIDA